MPVFSDYNNLSSYSSAYYYSPYSLSSRMSNALYSSGSSASLAPSSTSLIPTRGYYYPPRPIAIDTANIDVSSAQLPIRKTNTPATSAYGTIHRGRTVIRLKMSNMKDNPAMLRQKSPGRRLVEKFTIKDKPTTSSGEPKVASSAPIRRHISANRRKASLITEDGIPVPMSRKSSVTDEMLKEEEAIFDSLIMEEIARTNGIPERRNSLDSLDTRSGKPSRKKTKRYSVDFSEVKNGIANSESLSNFIEKLNAKVARSPSTDEDLKVPTLSVTDSTTENSKEKKNLIINADVSIEESSVAKKINYDVIIEESPERSPETTFTFVFKKPPEKKDKKVAANEDTSANNKSISKKVKLKKKAVDTLSQQIAINNKVQATEVKTAKSQAKNIEKPAKVPTPSKIEISKSKTAPALAPQPVQIKDLEPPKFPQKIELNKTSSKALISDVPSEVKIDPPKPVQIVELSKSSKALIDSTQPVPEPSVTVELKKPLPAPEQLKKTPAPTKSPKIELSKSKTDGAVAKLSSSSKPDSVAKTNNINKAVKKPEPKGTDKIATPPKNSAAPKNKVAAVDKAEKTSPKSAAAKSSPKAKFIGVDKTSNVPSKNKDSKEDSEPTAKQSAKANKVKKSTVKEKSKKSAKKSVEGIDDNNNKISQSAPVDIQVENKVNENGNTNPAADGGVPVSPRRRRSINWKMVGVGTADFEEEITQINGWFPEESESEESSSEEESDEESDSDEDDSDDSSSSSASPSRTSSNQELNLDSISLDSNTARKPYSCRHKIVHSHEGRIITPASTIPRFKKYSVYDFNFVKVLGKGSFGKVLLAELKGTEYYYAVKCLKKDVVLEDDDVECTLIERKVLTLSTKHPYLCHLFCTFQTLSHLFFVMEYLNGGDLMFHIQQSGRFDEGRARFYAAEIISGLRFLHKKGIVYRDLKLDNILLDCHGHVRIADFGMCKLQIYLDKTADTFCGTPDYMAPEIIKGLKYNQCVDWWSFGILMYEMVIGQSPFSGCDEDQLFWSICNEQPQYPRYLSVNVKSLLQSLLQKDATKRLGSLGCNSGDDVMAHDFFKSMDWPRLERKEVEPPYKPKVFHPLDTHYFDRTFTKEKPRLTPIEKTILESMDQTQFHGFSYTNPNATDC